MLTRLSYMLVYFAVSLIVAMPTPALSISATHVDLTLPNGDLVQQDLTGGAEASLTYTATGLGLAATALPGHLGASAAAITSTFLSGSAGASFSDNIHLLSISTGLPPSSLVPVTITLVLSGSFGAVGGPIVSGGPDAGVISDLFVNSGRVAETGADVLVCTGAHVDCVPASELRYTFSTNGFFTVGASLHVGVTASTSCGGQRACLLNPPTLSSASSNYLDTAQIFIAAPDGFSVVSDSGASYSAVPEPSTWVLLVSGLMALTAWRWRKYAT